MAVALFEMKKPEEARQEFEAVRRESGDHPNILYYLGRLDLEELHFESAIRNLNQAIAQPPFPDTAYYLGFAYFKQGDLSAAEKWLKEAAQLNPHDARVQYQLGLLYRKRSLNPSFSSVGVLMPGRKPSAKGKKRTGKAAATKTKSASG